MSFFLDRRKFGKTRLHLFFALTDNYQLSFIMKYYIISGEASGDLHGSNLIKEIKVLDANAEFRCWGGDLMQKQGVILVKHIRELAFMGFKEVILNIRTIFNNIDFCNKDITAYHPDVLILIDYPGFNLRIAQYAKEIGLKVFYYISPQVWAWKQNRVFKIKKVVDKMFVILPFEKDFFKKFDYEVDFVGHPLLDAIYDKGIPETTNDAFLKKHDLSEKPIIAILPGSRKQEISSMLPLMLKLAPKFTTHQFVIAGAPSIAKEFYANYIDSSNVKIIYNETYALLKRAKAALVTSGTATLETALFNVPEVVCYQAGAISFYIARRLIKVKYISLVNLIMDQEIVVELVQNKFNENELTKELDKILNDQHYRETMLINFHSLRQKLGGEGASRKTAELMLKELRK